MTNSIPKTKIIALFLTGFLMAFHLNTGSALAREEGRGPMGGPPPEAYAACEEKSEGESASFESPWGDTVTGTCVQDRDGERLVLKPDNPPEHRGGGRDRQVTMEQN